MNIWISQKNILNQIQCMYGIPINVMKNKYMNDQHYKYNNRK